MMRVSTDLTGRLQLFLDRMRAGAEPGLQAALHRVCGDIAGSNTFQIDIQNDSERFTSSAASQQKCGGCGVPGGVQKLQVLSPLFTLVVVSAILCAACPALIWPGLVPYLVRQGVRLGCPTPELKL